MENANLLVISIYQDKYSIVTNPSVDAFPPSLVSIIETSPFEYPLPPPPPEPEPVPAFPPTVPLPPPPLSPLAFPPLFRYPVPSLYPLKINADELAVCQAVPLNLTLPISLHGAIPCCAQ